MFSYFDVLHKIVKKKLVHSRNTGGEPELIIVTIATYATMPVVSTHC